MTVKLLIMATGIVHILTCFLGFLLFVSVPVRDIHGFKVDRRNEIEASFIVFAAGIITGSIWSWLEYGSLWSWDPKEIAAVLFLLSVFIYSKYRERGKQAIILCSCLAYCTILLAIVVPYIISTYHVKIMS